MVTPFGQIWSDHQLSWLSILWRPNLEATWCTETTFWMVWRASETTLLPPNLAFFMISLCLTAMVTLLALIWSDDQPRWPPGLLWPTLEDIWLPQTTLQMVWRAQEKTNWHPNQAYFLIFLGLASMVTLSKNIKCWFFWLELFIWVYFRQISSWSLLITPKSEHKLWFCASK